MYFPVQIGTHNVAALLDSGSSINVMSDSLFEQLPHSSKSSINLCDAVSIGLANASKVQVKGSANVQVKLPNGKCTIHVYILQQTSHPLILGTTFMHEQHIVLDFGSMLVGSKKLKVRSKSVLEIRPNSECIVMCKLPKGSMIGLQGVCSLSKKSAKAGLLVTKSVNTIYPSRKVPIKILNPSNTCIVVPRNTVLADFVALDSSYQVIPQNTQTFASISTCNNMSFKNVTSDVGYNVDKDDAYNDDLVHKHVSASTCIKNAVSETFDFDVHTFSLPLTGKDVTGTISDVVTKVDITDNNTGVCNNVVKNFTRNVASNVVSDDNTSASQHVVHNVASNIATNDVTTVNTKNSQKVASHVANDVASNVVCDVLDNVVNNIAKNVDTHVFPNVKANSSQNVVCHVASEVDNNVVCDFLENIDPTNHSFVEHDTVCSTTHNVVTEPSDTKPFLKFISYFDMNNDKFNLSLDQLNSLKQCVYRNRDVFVTDENPSLGFTTVVEHRINLKADAKPKYHKPYRLSPDKRDVLRVQLTNLLNQGIIAPLDEKEDVPISSPIVLVSKRKSGDNSTQPSSSY
ncbi:uncharacterized protein LOC117320371 isoform X2 [Pecten maximus]|uniref:uncharacterized protein LOC117320371 isoform X1 n=1 Tax=Pecten maximus TaxID=6579 RepID=UPI001458CCA8|nr:uncharacterized protein LOC117320371 isoform X1 [Pecten maximus]XP_033730865.1 uncharacterized protein LOC117320371 isoform X2 [Pecten maximus]